MPIKITVPGVESFDDENQVFVNTEPTVLVLEHSLVSLSKWESIFEKSFLANGPKTSEETLAYIHAMCLDEDVPGELLFRLTEENIKEVNAYIEAKMTATTFRELPGRPSREIITNEIIRHWMVSFNIPLEYENRHLNQLFTLIKVISEKNKPQKKMSPSDAAAQRRALNAQRRQQYGTSG
jgi:hypothetical protein